MQSERRFYAWIFDHECQEYIELSIDKDGRLFGFPDSSYDGVLHGQVALLNAIFPKDKETENVAG